jgi:hypothetical protein
LSGRNRCHGFFEFCGETDSNTNSEANRNASGNGNARANRDPGTFGHTGTDTDSGCRNRSMSAPGGLWHQ